VSRKKKAEPTPIWQDGRAWLIVGVFVVGGPVCSFLIGTLLGWIVSRNITLAGFVWLPFIYVYLVIPCLLMGLAAAASFYFRGRVLLLYVLAVAVVVSAVLFLMSGNISPGNYGTLLNHLASVGFAGIASWLLVRTMRKHAI
jgi:hypothetical protein